MNSGSRQQLSHEPYGLAHSLVKTRKMKWMLVVPRTDTPTDTINERLTCDVKILVCK